MASKQLPLCHPIMSVKMPGREAIDGGGFFSIGRVCTPRSS